MGALMDDGWTWMCPVCCQQYDYRGSAEDCEASHDEDDEDDDEGER